MGESEAQSKKMMVHHPLGQYNQASTTTPLQVKFVSASEVAITNNMDINAIPEISDEELLQMALMFEKHHQQ